MWKRLLGDGAHDDRVIVRIRRVTLEIPTSRIPNYVERDYEPITTEVFLNAIDRGAVVVDVGAHIGYYTCLAARAAGPTGSVHAIEPAPENVEVLRRNVQWNQFRNVAIHHLAAAAATESRRFQLTDASDSHGFYDHPLAHYTAAITVETRPVDDLVGNAARVIKIDVEGAELEVLNGMRRLLGMSPGATVIVEWNPQCLEAADRAPDDLPAMMDTLGVAGIAVIDDRRQLIRPLREVQAEMRRSGVPHGWYVNLCGVVR
jgi:FkbM family methyltransferase